MVSFFFVAFSAVFIFFRLLGRVFLFFFCFSNGAPWGLTNGSDLAQYVFDRCRNIRDLSWVQIGVVGYGDAGG